MYETVSDTSETLIRPDPRPVPPAGYVPILAEHCRITATKARRGVKHAPMRLQQLHCAVRLESLRPGTIRPHVVPRLSRKFTKKRFFGFRVSNRRPASSIGSQVEPRPFLEISAQDQLRSKGTKKNSRTAVVNMRSAGGRVQEPPSPHPPVQVPPLRPNLGNYGFGPLSQS